MSQVFFIIFFIPKNLVVDSKLRIDLASVFDLDKAPTNYCTYLILHT